MTGFGTATKADSNVTYTVEIKSLNSKFLELNLRIPKSLSSLELDIRNQVSKSLVRGKVYFSVNAEYKDPAAMAAEINSELFKKYFHTLQKLAKEVGAEKENLFGEVMKMPDVISDQGSDVEIPESEKLILKETIEEALLKFDEFRLAEGENLKEDLIQRTDMILQLLTEVESLEIKRIPFIRERITNLIEEWIGKEKMDENRFEQEMIFYIDKLDITEEKVRLRSHCDYFVKMLNSTEPSGKKLNFITQEMGREINTLGSKANHAGIQQLVVGMKEELEKIKEQILNVV